MTLDEFYYVNIHLGQIKNIWNAYITWLKCLKQVIDLGIGYWIFEYSIDILTSGNKAKYL